MAIIGTFTHTDKGTYEGQLITLAFQAPLVLEPVNKSNDKAPDFRIFSGDLECGAGWQKRSKAENEYIEVKIDCPTLPAPIYANLVALDGNWSLIWTRPATKKSQAS